MVEITYKTKGRPIRSKGDWSKDSNAAELHAYRYEQKAEKEKTTHCDFCGIVCRSNQHREGHKELYFNVMKED